jgi:predicted NBD/HSP70 family sugar kinase
MEVPLAFLPSPAVMPALDPGFRPAALAIRAFEAAAEATGRPLRLGVAVEQADGSIFHFERRFLPLDHPHASANAYFLERLAKFLLWSRGGWRLHVRGPAILGQQLARYYQSTDTGRFDSQIIGERVYERPLTVETVEELPPERAATQALGRHWNGCRIGFDLGGSDRKVAAVIDGEPVFTNETVWDPIKQSDPQYHVDGIMDSLKQAAAHLPRVDAIGGSAAGVYVQNRPKVASLFRAVPPDLFRSRVQNLFFELKAAWGGIPFEVANDGEVTALAGAMAHNQSAVLGVAMGTSTAAGYVTREGTITSWLNELAFVPVDYRPEGPRDEWSGDRGVGSQFFSQQAVGRLLPAAGYPDDPSLPLPEKLKFLQERMAAGEDRARQIYQTLGVCFGYGLAHFASFYDVEHVLVLGRVMTGDGGGLLLDAAREVLRLDFPSLHEQVKFHTPDETSKRHGQAVAAASLPWVGPSA